MGDIKLVRTSGTEVEELPSRAAAVERTLQDLLKRHLDIFLGARLLASKYSTGKTHGGRIDTLGIDEDNSPVIIEYKRATKRTSLNRAWSTPVEVHPQGRDILVYLEGDPTTVQPQPGCTRDVAKIGYFGTGDLESRIDSPEDVGL